MFADGVVGIADDLRYLGQQLADNSYAIYEINNKIQCTEEAVMHMLILFSFASKQSISLKIFNLL